MKTEQQTRREFLQASAIVPLAATFMRNTRAAADENLDQPNDELSELPSVSFRRK
jgi:uncharacterized protein (DUF1501 family)